MAQSPAQPRRFTRLLLSIPVVGWIIRDLLFGATDNIYYLIAALLSLWAVAVMTWGLVALTLVAVALVPVMFCILVWITWG